MVAACPRWRRRVPVWLSPLAALALLGCPLSAGPTTSQLQVQRASAAISSYDFGSGIVGVPGAAVTFTIVNVGTATVHLGYSALRITGSNAAEFATSGLSSTALGPGQSTTFSLSFNPAAPATSQARTAMVTISPESGGTSVSFTVRGFGTDLYVEQGGEVVSTYDFGTGTTGVGTTATFTIHNQGAVPIDLAAIQLTGDTSFSLSTPPPSPVQPGGTASFDITFTPSNYQALLSSTVTVASTGGWPAYSFTLRGMGTSGSFELRQSDVTPIPSGTVMDLGRVGMGTSRTFYIHNLSTGSDALHWTYTTAGDVGYFPVSLANPGTLAAGVVGGQSFVIAAGNKSLPPGTFSFTLTINTSDAGHPTFTLTMIITQP